MALASMGGSTAGEPVPAHDTGESFSLADTADIHIIADGKNIRTDHLTQCIVFGMVDTDFPQYGECVISGFFQMSEDRFGQPLFLLHAEPYLYGIVTIRGFSLDLGDDARSCLNDGNGNVASFW